ncbi:MAG: hypothetical protein UY50_C0032G0005 [Parcubacteria group bacterium GW2011_GWA2_49_9]|nr:MAG: hypothetical protein UY50_C0032G0005 [Parcubacteria group bacterium GW2011_GWA2_49_9]
MKPTTALFRLAYDGPALANHEMDVKDLAPALLAVGELLEEANSILNNNRVSLTVNIKATEPGSIDVVLSAFQSLSSQVVGLFNSDGTNALLNVVDILKLLGIGGGTTGLIALIKWIKNRPIKNITKIDTKNFKIEMEDGEVRMTNKTEIDLFSVLSIRKNMETIVHTPLKREGIEKVAFSINDKKEEINKKESEYFEAPVVSEEPIDEIEIEQSLQIVNISFQPGGKWRFSDGNATFFADILDEEFVEKVQRNMTSFAKDDVLRVKLKRKQSILSGSIKTDYIILKVLDHRSAAITIKLPFN